MKYCCCTEIQSLFFSNSNVHFSTKCLLCFRLGRFSCTSVVLVHTQISRLLSLLFWLLPTNLIPLLICNHRLPSNFWHQVGQTTVTQIQICQKYQKHMSNVTAKVVWYKIKSEYLGTKLNMFSDGVIVSFCNTNNNDIPSSFTLLQSKWS